MPTWFISIGYLIISDHDFIYDFFGDSTVPIISENLYALSRYMADNLCSKSRLEKLKNPEKIIVRSGQTETTCLSILKR